jgi:regulator of replication initiation timing
MTASSTEVFETVQAAHRAVQHILVEPLRSVSGQQRALSKRRVEFDVALDSLRSRVERMEEENERLKAAYSRLVERLKLATPQSLMEVTPDADSPPRDFRDEAVANVDQRHGFTYEFAPNPEAHRAEYGGEERRLRDER